MNVGCLFIYLRLESTCIFIRLNPHSFIISKTFVDLPPYLALLPIKTEIYIYINAAHFKDKCENCKVSRISLFTGMPYLGIKVIEVKFFCGFLSVLCIKFIKEKGHQ